MLKDNFPCTCGHIKDFHLDRLTYYKNYGIFLCLANHPQQCKCINYKSDNLLYLEQYYEKQL